MNKISLIGQIQEVDREIALRERVYPREIAAGKMRKEHADMLMDRIRAIRATLIFVKENEAGFREYVAAKKAGAQ